MIGSKIFYEVLQAICRPEYKHIFAERCLGPIWLYEPYVIRIHFILFSFLKEKKRKGHTRWRRKFAQSETWKINCVATESMICWTNKYHTQTAKYIHLFCLFSILVWFFPHTSLDGKKKYYWFKIIADTFPYIGFILWNWYYKQSYVFRNIFLYSFGSLKCKI